MPAPPADVRKIVVLRPNAVGDFIFALPALHALRAAFPEAHVTYIGLPWHCEFLAGRPGSIGRVAVIPPCPGVGAEPDAEHDASAVRAFVDSMRRESFDLAVQMYGGGAYSNPFIQRFGARLTIGMKADDAAPLDRWVAYKPLQNRRLQLLEVVALAGAGTWPLARELEVTGRDRQEAAQVLPPDDRRPLAVIQPGARDPRRRWPPDRFAAVADALAEAGAAIAINGTDAEGETVRAVRAAMRHPAADLTGKLSLSGLCGLLERAALLVSNDTGPLHLALAVGTPAVGIYWLTNLIESGPLRQDLHRPLLSVRLHCPVCGADNYRERCPHDVCFVDDVQTEEVRDLALEVFRARTG